jgi:hypothetical protein
LTWGKDEDFATGMTALRLAPDVSKDEFTPALREILGDIGRITEEKRNDTHLLLVTDGVTWNARLSDLRKLVEMQNVGLIARIYTQQMAEELEKDLLQLKKDHAL